MSTQDPAPTVGEPATPAPAPAEAAPAPIVFEPEYIDRGSPDRDDHETR